MTHTTAELYWLHMIFQYLKITLPTAPSLWCDNINTIVLASNPNFHARTKHIKIDYHFIKEKGVIVISKLTTFQHKTKLQIFLQKVILPLDLHFL